MTNSAPFSGNPADKYSLTGVIRKVLDKFLQKRIDDMLPAVVIAYNAQTNMAQVQPLITVITTEGLQVPRAQYAAIPVYQISAGGFIIRFPVKPGDTGWIKANDRDISLFKQAGTQSPPNTQRKHSFKDAIFMPQTLWKNATFAPEDASNLVIQSYDGSVKISLSSSVIKIVAPTEVIVDAPLTTFTGDIVVNGTFNVINQNGESTPCTINGSINATGDIVAGTGSANISLLNHVHGGVMTGGGETGGPVG